ncbi:MAG: SIS domain-containing protein [candidate division WOR-3 bacterium]
MIDLILSEIEESIEIKKKILNSATLINEAVKILTQSLLSGGKILICGNGGSAAQAQHFAAELVGKYRVDKRKGLAAIALTTDTSSLTAISNDTGFENVFSRQIDALGKEGDSLIAISTSGKSENVNRACKKAKEMGIKIIYLTGDKNPPVHEICDVLINVPSNSTPRIQEVHELILHIFAFLIEKEVINRAK